MSSATASGSTSAHPRDALAAGILSLSADRARELVFPALGVRENMTVQVLGDLRLRRPCLGAAANAARAQQLVA